MKYKKALILFLTLLIWTGCLYIGKDLSRRKPLWNDELYTQINTVDPLGYDDLLAGRSVEGNNNPLFYVVQKSLCAQLGCQLQNKWKGEWFVRDDRAQVALRVPSNVFMSTAIALTFYLVASFYSIGFAFLAVAIFFSLPATWMYWTEARPYSLWILLIVLQSIFFLRTLNERASAGFSWIWLALSNILLSLTIAVGAVQAAAVCLVLWLLKERRWLRYFALGVVPLAVGMFYLGRSPKFIYWFREGPWHLTLEIIPLEYWVLILLYAGHVTVKFLSKETRDAAQDLSRSYLAFALVIGASAIGLLGFLKLKAGHGPEGFAISSRYLLFLIPSSVVAATLAVRHIHACLKNDPWLRVNLWIVVCGLLALRAFKTYIFLLSSGTFMCLIQ